MRTIKLTKGQEALVDDRDFDELAHYKWHAKWSPGTQSYYAAASIWNPLLKRSITVLMHRQLLGVYERKQHVDHRDHNTLNNCRENLRVTDNRGNQANRKGKATGSYTSTHTGVSWHKSKQKWEVRAWIDGKSRHLGYFDSEAEGAEMYNEKIALTT